MENGPCGCCTETEHLTPGQIDNRPGLDALSYRVGTQTTFLETMKARLAATAIKIQREQPDAGDGWQDNHYPLQELTTREVDDPAIALLDSWAAVADVLTFYQERLANEGYLRTATERRSVLELARLVGYALRPGVAASTYLALTLDPGYRSELEPGQLRAQSIPGPGELPQTFENSETFEARADWNVLRPRLTRPQTAQSIQNPIDGPRVYLKGIGANLKVNDPILIDFGDGQPTPFRVVEVIADALADRTLLRLRPWQGAPTFGKPPMLTAKSLAVDLTQWSIRQRTVEADRIGISHVTKMYQRTVRVLDELQEQLQTSTTVSGVADFLHQETQPKLIKLQQTAESYPSYTRLREWLDGIVTELNAIVARADAQLVDSMASGFSLPNVAVMAGAQPRDAFKDVLTDLVKPTWAPPSNTLQLQRSLAANFHDNADAGLQTVSAFRPDLKATLPVAIGNTKVTPDSPIRIYAPRLKTGVYANNAPLKTIYDEIGRVSGQEEWPLSGTEKLHIQLNLRSGDSPPDQAMLVFEAGGAIYRTTLTNDDPKRVLGPLTALMTFVDQPTGWGLVIELTDERGDLFKLVSLIGADGKSVNVTIGTPQQEFTLEIALDQTQRFTSLDERVEMTFLQNRSEQYVLTIVDELLLPPAPKNVIALDAQYDQIAPGGWLVIQRGDELAPRIGQVVKADIVARTDYNFPARVSRLTMEDGQDWLKESDLLLSDVRSTTVYAQCEALALAEEVIDTPICGGDEELIELDGLYSDLQAGRWLIVSGERSDIKDANGVTVTGIKGGELAMLKAVVHKVADALVDTDQPGVNGATTTQPLPGDKMHTFIQLANKLGYCYSRGGVTIYANVVKATHGETRRETLGSGDGSKALQSFTVRQPPVTYVAAPTPDGAENTLQIFVNDVQWHETPALAGLQPNDRLFITRTDDDGKVRAIFGNGREGARLPTGSENIKSVYRNGIGRSGNVEAEQISLLVTRPLGIRGVVNPLRASGGADKENRDSARRNAPLAVTALDRLVSVQDYADFARTYAGIGKAVARRLSDGHREVVHVTIAGADDIPIDPSSDLYRNLLRALRQYGDPYQPLQLAMRELLLIVMSAGIRILPDYQWEPVVTNVRTRLLDTFSFERRDLGQDVLLSEAISTIQGVAGVAYVDVDLLRGIPEKKADNNTGAGGPGERRLLTPDEIIDVIRKPLLDADGAVIAEPIQRLVVNPAGVDKSPTSPAQLAFLSPAVPGTLILNQIR